MILVDRHIHALCQGQVPPDLAHFYSHHFWEEIPDRVKPMVSPYCFRMVNPASLDVRVGLTAKMRIKDEDGYDDIDLRHRKSNFPYWMEPGERCLVSSLETFHLPPFLCAQFRLKSSRGREWYEHMEAGFCDPGWYGSKLTMEIINMDLELLPLYPGLRMGQLVFSLTLGVPDKHYGQTGRYNGDQTVMASKG